MLHVSGDLPASLWDTPYDRCRVYRTIPRLHYEVLPMIDVASWIGWGYTRRHSVHSVQLMTAECKHYMGPLSWRYRQFRGRPLDILPMWVGDSLSHASWVGWGYARRHPVLSAQLLTAGCRHYMGPLSWRYLSSRADPRTPYPCESGFVGPCFTAVWEGEDVRRMALIIAELCHWSIIRYEIIEIKSSS